MAGICFPPSTEPSHSLESHTSDINGLAFSKHVMASCAGDKTVRLWSFPGFAEINPFSPLTGHSLYVNSCTFNPAGTLLASCSTDGKLILWNLNTGHQEAVLEHPSKGGIRVCKFSPNGFYLVSGSDDETLCIWESTSLDLIRCLQGYTTFVVTCAFSPDSKLLVSGCNTGKLRVWDMFENLGRGLLKDFEAHDLAMMGCDFWSNISSENNHTKYLLATCGQDALLKLWEIVSADRTSVQVSNKFVLTGHKAPVSVCCFAHHKKLLASGSFDKTIRLWDPSEGLCIQIFASHTRYVTCCAFSLDDSYLASGSNDKTIKVWIMGGNEPSTDVSNVSSIASQTFPSPENISVDSAKSEQQKPVCKWSVDDVCNWLEQSGLDKITEIFRKHTIDGHELLMLSDDVIEKQLGIEAYGSRSKIIRARDQLTNQVSTFSLMSLKEPPDEFLCPITREIMRDPVIASDGYTYERTAIESWIKSGSTRSPMTNIILPSQQLIPNLTVKMLIQNHATT
ncbi:WD repeat, SAM and U-box domain-containing protein 1 [Octopus bimaculoides]|uniref:WD repeat, SAM and U-box domain-containing protein 1 n=1 Tax=Octopus bimaculoides TaxID=37653 RepID=A0A0L8I9V3_OCTBM|nr:WD repeat, SAM and U-box domain-containing protein 1 [Octopus bimaculoides]|eukprot:XP_014783061.1 PREDICTED: WD repeat, SAM and U-box domain-containing protein 1-like [Octopus bimaculoides]